MIRSILSGLFVGLLSCSILVLVFFNKELKFLTIPVTFILTFSNVYIGSLIGTDRLSIFPFKWRTEKEAAIFGMINSKVQITSKEFRAAYTKDLDSAIDKACSKKDI
jgi:hypothetical protein